MSKITNKEMMPEELAFLDLFKKHAASESVAKRVYKLVKSHMSGDDLVEMRMSDILLIPGIGRQAALLVMEVACDLAGKK